MIGAGSNLCTGDDCNGANSVSVLHVCGDNNILSANVATACTQGHRAGSARISRVKGGSLGCSQRRQTRHEHEASGAAKHGFRASEWIGISTVQTTRQSSTGLVSIGLPHRLILARCLGPDSASWSSHRASTGAQPTVVAACTRARLAVNLATAQARAGVTWEISACFASAVMSLQCYRFGEA
jgi:hypothetical protein